MSTLRFVNKLTGQMQQDSQGNTPTMDIAMLLDDLQIPNGYLLSFQDYVYGFAGDHSTTHSTELINYKDGQVEIRYSKDGGSKNDRPLAVVHIESHTVETFLHLRRAVMLQLGAKVTTWSPPHADTPSLIAIIGADIDRMKTWVRTTWQSTRQRTSIWLA